MISMTGFGYQEASFGRFRYSVEMKSLNNRYLDLFINLPPALSSREGELRTLVQSSVSRGRVEVTIRVKETTEEVEVRVNQEAVAQALGSLKTLKKAAGLGGRIKLDHLLTVQGLVSVEKNQDWSGLWEPLLGTFSQVTAQYQASRGAEGKKLTKDILAHLQILQNGREQISAQAGALELQLRETLQRRLRELGAEVEETRMHGEIALLLVKYSVNEEIVRLGAHLDSFLQMTQESGPVGKKLDFLCQEIGREINTIGSKTSSSEVQHIVVGLKDALENIREQLRNVE